MNRAFRPARLHNTTLKNAFIKTATFEGMYDDGIPTQKLIDHHVSMARGGVAMTTVSYAAVSPDGRTFKSQMVIHDKSLQRLRVLAQEVHQAGAKVSIQLTHCGYFSKNTDQKRPLAPSKVFNEYGFMSGIMFSRAMTDTDMQQVSDEFATAALRLKEAGFDAVELHMGHGYLLSQFLSPWTNRRKDDYGGPVANRARFPLEVFQNIRQKVGADYPILVKLNLSDGFSGGFTLKECQYVAGQLQFLGCAAIVLSGGFTSKTPFYLMRGKIPLRGMIQNGDSWAEKLTMMLFGPLLIKKYQFEPNFFLRQARIVRKTVKMPLVYLGGVDSRVGIEEILDAGFEFIAIGRALLHDPDFLLKLKDGLIQKSACTRCNQCIVEMDRLGVRCVL